jgi:hypothetical protein
MQSQTQPTRLLDAWRALGGGEIRKKRGQAFWRKSKDWNVALDLDKDVYYDHVSGTGGSPVSLVMQVLNYSPRDAGRWLREQFGPANDGTHQRREKAEEERAAAQKVAIALRWHIENELELANLVAWSPYPGRSRERVRELTQQLESIDTWTPSEAISRLREMAGRNPRFIAHLYDTYQEFETDFVRSFRGGRS